MGMRKFESKETIKIRQSLYCNLKLLLLFLTVYGHLIEGRIGESTVLCAAYRLIYMVHMPLFVFLSGYFLKNSQRCFEQARRAGLLYLVCQGGIVAVDWTGYALGLSMRVKMNIWTPYWHLWYLLSLAVWAFGGGLWYELAKRRTFLQKRGCRLILIVLAVIIAGLAGGCCKIGRCLSLSRTICFAPFFWAGMFCPGELVWRRYRLAGAVCLVFGLAAIALWGGSIPAGFLYHANGYAYFAGISGLLEGAGLRLLCFGIAACLGLFLLSWTPELRVSVSRAGSETLWVYLLHAPCVKCAAAVSLPLPVFLWAAPAFSAYVIYLLYKVFQWRSAVCGIARRLPGKG